MPPRKQAKEINKFRSLFPDSVRVKTERLENGGFFAEITTFSGCFTEAESFSELIEMVNDAVRTYFEIPEEYLPYMPTYLPPLKEAQRLDAFPIMDTRKEVNLKFSRAGEEVKC